MLFNESDIIAKAWLTKEVVNLVLAKDKLEVDKVFLIGSYANKTATSRSDIDFLIQLKGGTRPGQYYTTWENTLDIQKQLGRRVHIIFGTEIAAQRLHEKHKNEIKNYRYREISQGVSSAYPRRPLLSQ